jgi:hypothetical protein
MIEARFFPRDLYGSVYEDAIILFRRSAQAWKYVGIHPSVVKSILGANPRLNKMRQMIAARAGSHLNTIIIIIPTAPSIAHI